MIVYGKSLVVGANLTIIFQSYMSAENAIIPVVDGVELPIAFSHYCIDIKVIEDRAERRKMTRGMVHLPLRTIEEIMMPRSSSECF